MKKRRARPVPGGDYVRDPVVYRRRIVTGTAESKIARAAQKSSVGTSRSRVAVSLDWTWRCRGYRLGRSTSLANNRRRQSGRLSDPWRNSAKASP